LTMAMGQEFVDTVRANGALMHALGRPSQLDEERLDCLDLSELELHSFFDARDAYLVRTTAPQNADRVDCVELSATQMQSFFEERGKYRLSEAYEKLESQYRELSPRRRRRRTKSSKASTVN